MEFTAVLLVLVLAGIGLERLVRGRRPPPAHGARPMAPAGLAIWTMIGLAVGWFLIAASFFVTRSLASAVDAPCPEVGPCGEVGMGTGIIAALIGLALAALVAGSVSGLVIGTALRRHRWQPYVIRLQWVLAGLLLLSGLSSPSLLIPAAVIVLTTLGMRRWNRRQDEGIAAVGPDEPLPA